MPKNIQSDNGSEFKNKVIDNYWRAHNINRIYGAPYKPRSQGAVEGFNKTIERGLRKAYYNLKYDGKEFDVEYELNLFLYFYNWNRAHSTTKLIPRDVFYGKEESGIRKDCQINTKKMHRNKVMDAPFNEGEEILLSNWIYEQKTNKKKINLIVYQQPKIARKNKKSETFWTIVNIKEKLHHNCVVTIIDYDSSIELLKKLRRVSSSLWWTQKDKGIIILLIHLYDLEILFDIILNYLKRTL